MGLWGTGIFSDDLACDIRDHYRERIEDGVEDAEATRLTLNTFSNFFDDPEGGAVCIVALAVTQSKIGRLDLDIRNRALAAIDNGADLAVWERDNPKLLPKRREAFERARAQLTGPQPARRRLRPPRRPGCGLIAGDALALTLSSGVVLLRVVRVKPHRRGETPVLEELQLDRHQIPSPEELERLEPRIEQPILHPLSTEPRFTAFTGYDKIGWEQAGFKKVASLARRIGDEEASLPSNGIAWSALAERFRRRR
jgi:hypothetical protein